MTYREFSCEVEAPLERVWEFHNTIETLFTLTPPHTKARLGNEAKPMAQGVIYRLVLKRAGIPLPPWDAEIIEYTPPSGFVDRQVEGRGPFKAWTHAHIFESITPNRTRIRDCVTYTPPFGILGILADRLFIGRDLEQMFAYRYKKTRQILENKNEDKAP